MMLRLIADDLTGALDAAAPFAAPDAPVRLMLRPGGAVTDRLCHSTESRDLKSPAAIARVARATAALLRSAVPGAPCVKPCVKKGPGAENPLWFKKVDSVLRGHPLAETLAMAWAGGFATCVFAPAFPQMGRITRNGHQMLRGPAGDWQDVGAGDLRAGFAALGPHLAPHVTIVVIDAEDQAALQEQIKPWRDDPLVLWAGSRGLAQALVPAIRPLALPPVGAFILGTAHPATRAQAQGLAGLARVGPPAAADPLLIDPVPDCHSGAQTRACLRRMLHHLPPPADGSALLVTGGDSLTILLRALRADALECLGEVGPGLPLSRLIGGRMAGVMLISKSGGFGGPDLLRAMLPV